jgi:potassium-transporting ATPase KdpC subunit
MAMSLAGQLRPALVVLAVLTVLTGLAYPLALTGFAQVVLPRQANGSLVTIQGRVVGSSLLGQAFSDLGYFWPRPSATTPFPYNPVLGAGSNLGPTNPALLERVAAAAARLHAADPTNTTPLPADLVTASASGLDPEISPAAALWQVPRVARARGISESALLQLVALHTSGRQLGFLGEPRVNVLALNLALDAMRTK